MYEQHFRFQCRPFPATPHLGCFFASTVARDSLTALTRCLDAGYGIAVLTGASGLGKTMVLRRLLRSLQDRFDTAFVPTAGFPTRSALLQSILYELKCPYARMGEQELRLELQAYVGRLRPRTAGLLLAIDEAHLLNDRLLEELRALTTLADEGQPAIRLVLAGQPQFEERLMLPAVAAFSQRVACQSHLVPLSRQESMEYIAHHISWAGGDVHSLFERRAIDLITYACDGIPRCINHLCDHALMLAFIAGQPRVSVRHIVDALEDLKRLPLQWNIPASLDDLTSHDAPATASPSAASSLLASSSAPSSPAPSFTAETTSRDSTPAVSRSAVSSDTPSVAPATPSFIAEAPVAAPEFTPDLPSYCIEVGSDEFASPLMSSPVPVQSPVAPATPIHVSVESTIPAAASPHVAGSAAVREAAPVEVSTPVAKSPLSPPASELPTIGSITSGEVEDPLGQVEYYRLSSGGVFDTEEVPPHAQHQSAAAEGIVAAVTEWAVVDEVPPPLPRRSRVSAAAMQPAAPQIAVESVSDSARVVDEETVADETSPESLAADTPTALADEAKLCRKDELCPDEERCQTGEVCSSMGWLGGGDASGEPSTSLLDWIDNSIEIPARKSASTNGLAFVSAAGAEVPSAAASHVPDDTTVRHAANVEWDVDDPRLSRQIDHHVFATIDQPPLPVVNFAEPAARRVDELVVEDHYAQLDYRRQLGGPRPSDRLSSRRTSTDARTSPPREPAAAPALPSATDTALDAVLAAPRNVTTRPGGGDILADLERQALRRHAVSSDGLLSVEEMELLAASLEDVATPLDAAREPTDGELEHQIERTLWDLQSETSLVLRRPLSDHLPRAVGPDLLAGFQHDTAPRRPGPSQPALPAVGLNGLSAADFDVIEPEDRPSIPPSPPAPMPPPSRNPFSYLLPPQDERRDQRPG